jgi:hypothetical protein
MGITDWICLLSIRQNSIQDFNALAIATHMTFMGVPDVKTSDCSTSSCRYCIHYTPSGRRGGNCQQLGVPVQSNWKACPLALRAFAASWNELESEIGIVANWHDDISPSDDAHLTLALTTVAVSPATVSTVAIA